MTPNQGMVRREFDDHGSFTRRAAREAIDLHAWADGQDFPNADADRRAMAVDAFAAVTNRGTTGNTLPNGGGVCQPGSDEYRQSADAVIDAIMRHGLESR